jgi:FtsP/CotA-like multicopper oxidase with cupredoxin domain
MTSPIRTPFGFSSTANDDGFTLTRRRFVQGVTAAGLAALVEGNFSRAGAETIAHSPSVLTGNQFDLAIKAHQVDFTGRRVKAIAVNGSSPGPTLKWHEGDTVTVAVTNHLPIETSIHWHGIRVPALMDGVPGLSFAGIAPGKTFVYRIPVLQNGTYWYHSHSGFQEQIGLSGALVIEPRDKDPIAYDRDYVVLLSDWSDTSPKTLYSNLKKQSDYYNFHKRTTGTFIHDVRSQGSRSTVADRLSWGRMNMSPTDIADVTSATYIHLMNGNPADANWTALFKPGERVRLRLINGSAMTFFDLRIPGLPMTVVQADGNYVQPVTVDEIRLGVAETYDVIVQPREETAYTIFAQPESRGSYARGTLAPRMGMTAEIPPMDPYPLRTMADMGMGGMAQMKGMNMSGMTSHQMPGMKDMQLKGMSDNSSMPDMKDMNRSGMKDGGMSAMSHMHMDEPTGPSNDQLAGRTPFLQPGPRTTRLMPPPSRMMSRPAETMEGEAPLHVGPEVVSVAMKTSPRLHDPGDGLNENGRRRVLTYSDLRALYKGVDGRPPTREIILHLTGNMQRFIWGFDGYKFSQAEPIHLKLGERVRFVLINDTMMEHPIHLHGLWSELENGSGEFSPYKHTVTVKPAERVSYLVSADTPGRWAFHCHLLYHMAAGMFRTVVVS